MYVPNMTNHIVNFREILSGFGWILNMQCSLKNIDIFANTISSWDDQINSLQFTKKANQNSTKLTLCNNYFQDGSTCAHIAAAKGSLGVVEELMKHDLNVVLNSRNKVTDSTPLHIATEGGHFDVVKKLLDAGASAADENKAGKKCRVLLN